LSSKKQRIDHASCSPSPQSAQPVIKPDTNLLKEYAEFVDVCPAIREQVFQILDQNEVTHPKFFLSKIITPTRMLEWGLKDGVIAQLKDNVFNFDHYLASKESA
jgi:hypothetical protein